MHTKAHSESSIIGMNWNPANAVLAIAPRLLFLTFVFLFLTLTAQSARPQTFTVIHTFTGPDGSYPQTGLTMDAAGNLYGTTIGGGATNNGTVFELNNQGSGWMLNTLYSFSWPGSGGSDPQGRVAIAQDGSFVRHGAIWGYRTMLRGLRLRRRLPFRGVVARGVLD